MDDEFDEELDDEEGNYQDYESEVLAWENYTQFEDIATDGNLTLLIPLGDSENVEEEILGLIEILEKKQFQIKTRTNNEDYEIVEIFFKNIEIAILFRLENCLAVRVLNSKENKIVEILEKEFEDEVAIGEINHIKEELDIPKSSITAIIKTGTVKENKSLEPHSFWKFFIAKEEIGKALIRFHVCEMNDCAPTIMMFEVYEEFRRNGHGSQMLESIEKYMCEHNFHRLRLDTTKATPFWRDNGFEIDIDEGEKELDCLYYEFED